MNLAGIMPEAVLLKEEFGRTITNRKMHQALMMSTPSMWLMMGLGAPG